MQLSRHLKTAFFYNLLLSFNFLSLTFFFVSLKANAEEDARIEYSETLKINRDEVHGATRFLTINAFGREFELILEENTSLIGSLSTLDLSSNYKIYRGYIAGIPGSWSRISDKPSGLSGAFFDGDELYFIEDQGSNSRTTLQSGFAKTQLKANPVLIRESDIKTLGSCGSDHGQQSSHPLRASVSEPFDPNFVALPASASQALNMVIVADTEYASRVGGIDNVPNEVIALMNTVDGIFSEQVGVSLVIQEIMALTDNQNLTPTGASNLLRALGTFVQNNIDNPGLVHLFTGKELNSNTVGIAALPGICGGNNGIGLSQAFLRGSGLVIAHEIGHNFGAPHDNESGSVCAGTPGNFLMNPIINGSDDFSNCSLDRIQSTLNSRGSCIVAVNNGEPTPTPEPTATPEPTPSATPIFLTINGEQARIVSYENSQDVEGTVNILDGGDTISLRGNNWKAAEFSYTVTENTVLEFEFRSDTQGDLHSIGFDTDTAASTQFGFNLYGTQTDNTSTIQAFDNYAEFAPNVNRYVIPVGEFYTGDQNFIFFQNDDDDGEPNAHSQYSNILVYEGPQNPSSTPTPTASPEPTVSPTSSPSPIPVPTVTADPDVNVTPVPLPTARENPIGNNGGDGLIPGADAGGGGSLNLYHLLILAIFSLVITRRKINLEFPY